MTTKFSLWLKWGFWPLLLIISACAGNSPVQGPPTLMQMKLKPNDFNKKAAVLMIRSPHSEFINRVEDYFKQVLIETMHAETDHLLLVHDDDKELEASILSSNSQAAWIDQAALVETARYKGYQAVVVTRFAHIDFESRKSGMFWFRKDRYYIDYGFALDVFDPATGAKMAARIVEETARIQQEEYESLQNGSQLTIDAFDEKIADLAENLGEKVASVLNDSLWRTNVVGVQADRVFLPAGKNSGIAVDDRLVVFKTQPFKETQSGYQFLLPEHKAAELRVVAVGDELTETVAEPPGTVQEWDLAIPLN
jgi:hypothetical protein